MKIAMCTHYAGDEYKKKMDIGIQSKVKYCKKHNIEFILEDETADYFDKDRRYEWCKILMLKKHIKNYDYLFWSDADVLIKNFDYSLLDYLKNCDKTKTFIFTKCYNFINNGNFFIKNDEYSIPVLDVIYNQTEFKDQNCCEQSATINVILNYPLFKNIWYIEPNARLFNAYSIYHYSEQKAPQDYQNGDFLIHYAGIGTDETNKCMIQDSTHTILTRHLYKDFHPNLGRKFYEEDYAQVIKDIKQENDETFLI